MNTRPQFLSPWTGGNPKRGYFVRLEQSKFLSPWTGGNPKQRLCSQCVSSEFLSPWTGGNPKRRSSGKISRLKFLSPWTGGNPKLTDAAFDIATKFLSPWTGGNPKQRRLNVAPTQLKFTYKKQVYRLSDGYRRHLQSEGVKFDCSNLGPKPEPPKRKVVKKK